MRFFYFGLDRKIPESRGSGSGYENLEKISRAKFRDFYPRDFRKSPGINAKSLGFGIFLSSEKPPLLHVILGQKISKRSEYGILELNYLNREREQYLRQRRS